MKLPSRQTAAKNVIGGSVIIQQMGAAAALGHQFASRSRLLIAKAADLWGRRPLFTCRVTARRAQDEQSLH